MENIEKKELDIADKENILDEENFKLKQYSSILSNQVIIFLERCDAKMNGKDGSTDCKLLEQKNVQSRSSMDDEIYSASGNVTMEEMNGETAVHSFLSTSMKSSANHDFVPSTQLSELDGHVQIVSKDIDETKSLGKVHSKDVYLHSKTVKGNGEKKLDQKTSTELMTDDAKLSSVNISETDKDDIAVVLKKPHGINGEKKVVNQTARKSMQLWVDEDEVVQGNKKNKFASCRTKKRDKGDICTGRKKSQPHAKNGEKMAAKQTAGKFKKLCAVRGERRVTKHPGRSIEKRSDSPSFISQSAKKCRLEAIDTVYREEVTRVANRSRKHATKYTWKEKVKKTKQDPKTKHPTPTRKPETYDESEKNSNLQPSSPSTIGVPSDSRSTDHSPHLCDNHLIENLALSHKVCGKDSAIFSQNRNLDEDEHFFISIMSSVKTLSEQDKIDFRLTTIQLLRDIRNRSVRSSFAMEHDIGLFSNFTRV